MLHMRDHLQNVIPIARGDLTGVASKFETNEGLSLTDKLTVYQTLTRTWRRHLSPDEGWLLLYLVDRSIGWGRDNFTAMAVNVLMGNAEFAGCGFSRSKYFRLLVALEARGVISRVSLREKTQITINVGWTPEEAMSLPIPKRLKTNQPVRSVCGDTPRSVTGDTQSTVVRDYTKKNTEEAADAPPSGIFVRTRTRPTPEKKEAGFLAAAKIEDADQWNAPPVHPVAPLAPRPAKPGAGVLKASDVEVIWRLALTDTFPMLGQFAWSMKDKGRVNQALKKWSFKELGTFGQMTDHAVRNWTQIISRKMAWMTTNPAPRVPDLGFFLARITDFIAVWQSRELDRFGNDQDQREYDRMKARGLTHDEAIRSMARKDAVGALRDEMQAREQTVQQRERIAKAREDGANRMDKFMDGTQAAGAGKRVATLSTGEQVEITPGSTRRPGQVWGHTPVIRVVPPEVVIPFPTEQLKPLLRMPDLPSYEETMRLRSERLRAEIEAKTRKGNQA